MNLRRTLFPGRARAKVSTRTLHALLRVAIGALLIVSGLYKLQLPYDFLWTVYDYELLAPKASFVIAYVLPWMELVLGISLIAAILERGAWILSVIAFFAFTLAKASVLARGLKIPCGCFTPASGPAIDDDDVLFTALLMVAAITGLILSVARGWREVQASATAAAGAAGSLSPEELR